MYKCICISMLVLSSFISKELNAQVGITGVPFLEINNDARSIGMGGATVALKGGKAGLHLNPATFGIRNTIQLSTLFNTDDSYGFFGKPWLAGFTDDLQIYNSNAILGFKNISVGYQFTLLDLGEQPLTSVNSPEIIDTFNSYEYAHTFSISIPVSEYFSFGAGLNYFKSSMATGQTVGGQTISDATGLTIDFGTYFEYPVKLNLLNITPSLAWSLTDFGYPLHYTENSQKDPLPMIMRGGFGVKLDLEKELFNLRILSVGMYGSLEKLMARNEKVVNTVGGTSFVSYEAVGPIEALFKSWGPYERFNGQETISLNVWEQFRRQSGLEVTLLEILSLRFGHNYEHPENGNRVYNTFGIGIQYKYFSFDYATLKLDEEYNPLVDTDFYELTINIPMDVVARLVKKI